jgi:DNA-binding LacI/PurR family transcriptional regulator
VDYKTDMMGNLTVKILETVLAGKESSRLLMVSPELIVRESA